MNTLIKTMDEAVRFARAAAESGYFQDASDTAQAMVKIAYGLDLGMSPVAALSGIHIVKGKPCLSATTVAALIKRSGRYNIKVLEHTRERCSLAFFENGEHVGDVTFDLDDARDAGILDNPMWRKYPKNMLFARAVTNGARWYCADVFHGAIYTKEEMGAEEVVDFDVTIDESVDAIETDDKTEERQALPPHVEIDDTTANLVDRLVEQWPLRPDNGKVRLRPLLERVKTCASVSEVRDELAKIDNNDAFKDKARRIFVDALDEARGAS